MLKITILGARGSIPTEGKDMMEFGGATSCVLVETDENAVFLDAGTGITAAPEMPGKKVSVFITHPHIDHLLGIPFFPYLAKEDGRIDFYATSKNTLGTGEQIAKILSEPLWPCTINDYAADVRLHDLAFPVEFDGIKVTGMNSNHPGGSTIFKVEYDGLSVVYATDYEHTEKFDEELIEFCRGATLLLYDGQYTPEEYDIKKGYGHSTAGHGMEIMKKSGAKMMRIVHHDPGHGDDMLRRMEEAIKDDNTAFARQGEEIWLQR
ncbi:MAG: MBL fold metallo-hydrolase [Lachnospiraceae bacterium]|nr:MBL fold metallo-hydrolase [Lachnospiraceae bacterium]